MRKSFKFPLLIDQHKIGYFNLLSCILTPQKKAIFLTILICLTFLMNSQKGHQNIHQVLLQLQLLRKEHNQSIDRGLHTERPRHPTGSPQPRSWPQPDRCQTQEVSDTADQRGYVKRKHEATVERLLHASHCPEQPDNLESIPDLRIWVEFLNNLFAGR